MRLLVVDTATSATVVGVRAPDGRVVERRHDPAQGERPGHIEQVLALVREACAEAGVELAALERIGAGIGPGSFTGLRIGIATVRALAHATGVPVAAVSTLGALAVAAGDERVAAVLDARRGEAFAAVWEAGREVLAPRAVRPEGLDAIAAGAALAVGDGAVRFREHLTGAGAVVPQDASSLHRVGAAGLLALAAQAPPVPRDALVPHYARDPDARPRRTAPT